VASPPPVIGGGIFAGWPIVLMLSGTFAQLGDYAVFGIGSSSA
jgi:hypothetical protein